MECGALAPLSARDFSPRGKEMDDPTLHGGPDKQVPPRDVSARKVFQKSEGHACRARGRGVDDRTLHGGPDKQVPPRDVSARRVFQKSEGHACRPRGTKMDNPTLNHGPDKRVPPMHGLEGRFPFRPIHPSTEPPSTLATLAGAPVTVQNRQEKSKLAYRAGWRSGIPGNQPGSVPPCRVVQSPGDSTGQIHLPRRRTWVPASWCGVKTHTLAFP